MNYKSLSDRLVAYFKRNPGIFIASGDIQRLVTEKTNKTASNATRRLRELAEDGTLEVEYRKGHSYYRYNAPATRTVRRIEVVDGVAKEIIETIKS